MTREEENRIIDAVLGGDADAFEALVLAHQTGVYNLTLRMLGNEQDALDASQEAFFRAYRALPRFRRESRFSVWLYRLASNICLDMLRRRPSVPYLSLTDEDDGDLPLPDTRPGPQEALERTELRRAVQAGIAALPPEFRQALVLREVNGLSYDDIARVTGLEPGTVKSRIFRARKKLAQILSRGGNFSDAAPSQKTERRPRGKGGAHT